MPEPSVTDNYQWPRQLPGQASRTRMNAAVDAIDSTVASLAGLVATLSLLLPHIKIYEPITPVEGATTITLPEPFQYPAKRLFVTLGGLTLIQGVHFDAISATTLQFSFPLHANELISIIEFQQGNDSGAPVGIPPGEAQTTEEVPAGVIDSTDGFDGNGVFTLSHPIADDSVPTVVINHFLELTPNVHYTWAGNTITFAPGSKPVPGETPVVTYLWRFS